ncbi:uncharacterized protein LOC141612381 isoform X2 [Silene latifolia]|uniref:uncharacterized protein LOC141612381 isoform X2 n=1 Tax=Silene latifolia TaxID=37657 RepID=UPI003D773981
MAATLTPVSPRRSSVSGKYSDESTATSTADSASSSPSSSCYLSECSLDDDEFVDLELGADIGDTAVDTAEVVEGGKVSVDLSNMEKECRICHMSLLENGLAIELGCCCKDDLAVAHQHCANTWFKIRGNNGGMKGVSMGSRDSSNVETRKLKYPTFPPHLTRSFSKNL